MLLILLKKLEDYEVVTRRGPVVTAINGFQVINRSISRQEPIEVKLHFLDNLPMNYLISICSKQKTYAVTYLPKKSNIYCHMQHVTAANLNRKYIIILTSLNSLFHPAYQFKNHPPSHRSYHNVSI